MNIIYSLARCDLCEIDYAVAPDPYFPGQYLFFDRRSMQTPSHMAVASLVCQWGHPLVITAKQAVLSESGDWLKLQEEGQACLN